MFVQLGIDGFWELRSRRDNSILFQMHDDQIPNGENPDVWVRETFIMMEFE